jgi:hypothetical protein
MNGGCVGLAVGLMTDLVLHCHWSSLVAGYRAPMKYRVLTEESA